MPSDDERRTVALQQFLADAAEARENVEKFFSFCMRSEKNQAPMKLAPHQEVGIKFMMDHERSVNLWPIGVGKTYLATAITLWLIGRNPSLRGAIVSATREQAAKPVGMVRDYIEQSPHVRAVFPHLRPSPRKGDSWTQHDIVVDRPPGIRDATLVAHGIDSGTIVGSRLNWIIVDDILNRENTSTPDQRAKVRQWFDNSVLSRLDPKGAKVIVINTAWHPDDLVHYLCDPTNGPGWAMMKMDILGGIAIQDDREREVAASMVGERFKPWTHKGLRPASKSPSEEKYRLRAHDPDPKNETPLWPGERSIEWIAQKRREHLPHEFNRLFLNECRDDGTSRCKYEYIEKSLELARQLGVKGFSSSYRGSNMTFTGLDLAISPGEENDMTAFFTFEARPDGTRVILDIDIGQWDGPTNAKKLIQKVEAYNSIVRVENNGGQGLFTQFLRAQNKSIPIKAQHTGRVKAHPEAGVEGIFLEMSNGAWAFPNDRGELHPMMKKFIDACLYYTPTKHTPDELMAAYLAREQAKEWGVLSGSATGGMGGGPGLASSIMSR